MKNLFMGAICLSLFAIALSLVQISCSKTEAQNSTNNITSVNKILIKEEYAASSGCNTRVFSIMNYDGSGLQHLNIPFPAGFCTSTISSAVLSPDATKIFFAGRETAFTTSGIYSCDTSGLNFARIASCDPNSFEAFVAGAY